ncbi:50S ribosomal protein L5 [Candidatus Saccharibacteria bacterium]|nr:50S ribosomal protein L5 [Candidatus Saccharibacteria bacterium]
MADAKTTKKPSVKKTTKAAEPANVIPTEAEGSKIPRQARNDKNAYVPRLKKLYSDQIVKELQKDLSIKNVHDLPKLTKIIVSSGTGRNRDNKAYQATVENTLKKITGQQPISRLAKKSIATFKIRKNMGAPVGQTVTLRGDKMWEFLDRLVNVAMPRIRDFHGVSAKAFDRQGNYSLGIVEQSIFPELTFEETTTLHGLQVTFAIDKGSKEASRALLEKFGIPFEKEVK